MFLKMIRKDIRSSGSLNVIIILFMIAASVLLVSASVFVYGNLEGNRISRICSEKSDISLIVRPYTGKTQETLGRCEGFMSENSEVLDHTIRKIVSADSSSIDFENTDEEHDSFIKSHLLFFSQQPKKYDLVFDTEDKPFSLSGGNAAVSCLLAESAGVKTGDRLRITTQAGNIYEFTVSSIYKSQSDNVFSSIFLSDSDFDRIISESPSFSYLYSIRCVKPDNMISKCLALADEGKNDMIMRVVIFVMYGDDYYNSDTRLTIVSFMMLICIFLVMIILVSVRFTLLSAIKAEKKEIGMMRAAGVDSLGFRLLFSAKYFAFTAAGGVIGLVSGIPLGKFLVVKFSPNCIVPPAYKIVSAAVAAELLFIVFMVLYILAVMRNIGKITVVDALHGDSRGERFGKVTRMYLYKRRFMRTDLYLALTDIINDLKRYAFLIIIYSLGTMIMLFGFHLKSSLVSEEYEKYFLIEDVDFSLNMASSYYENEIKKAGNDSELYRRINEDFKQNGIPAVIKTKDIGFVSLVLPEGIKIDSNIIFGGEYDSGLFKYRKGGTAPVLKNEVALSSFSAHRYGIEPGDTVTLEYEKLNGNSIKSQRVTEDFIVTAIAELMEGDKVPFIIMSDEFEGAQALAAYAVSYKIEGNEKQRTEVVRRMKERYGNDTFLSKEETIYNSLGYITDIVDLLKILITAVTLFVFFLVTVLHCNVLFYEDISSSAFLRCTGFSISFLKRHVVFRTMIIAAVSVSFGVLLSFTAGNVIAERLFRLEGLYGFRFVIEWFSTFVSVPLILLMTVLTSVLLNVRNIKNIKLSSVNCE